MALVLFASQTGNAESIAVKLAGAISAEGHSVTGPLSINNAISDGALGTDRVTYTIFVCSTTGDGDFPDNGSKFKRWAKKLEGSALKRLRFAVLALGSTDYS